jgi:hypothetical protein
MAGPPKPRGRPASLDEEKRAKLVALLANGSSRRAAAFMVGCAPSTVIRTALRDPRFAEQLARAERNVEVEALRAIRDAAKQPCYWRAAAWMLERRNPDDFAHRPPKMFSRVEVLQLVSTVCEMLVGDVPEQNCQRAQEYLERLMFDLRNELANAADLTPPALVTPPAEEPPEPQGPLGNLDALDDDESGAPRVVAATPLPILGTNLADFEAVSCVVSSSLQTSCGFVQHVPHLWYEVTANAGQFNTLCENELRNVAAT